jgi:3-hydroxyacyl-CoA dehydrogenase/enoyl-CoA hydratase/3-hydroxybutyryl-CoA epimerase
MLGTEYAVARCDELEFAYGPRFAAPDLLREMAEEGDAFHDRFAS